MKNAKQLLVEHPRAIVSVSPEDSVLQALKIMASQNVGAVLVLESGQLVGIFSERDYARKVVLQGKSSEKTTVRQIMTQDPVTVSCEITIEQCMQLMTDRHFRHLPVMEDGKLIGVISIGDVMRESMVHLKFVIQELERYISG